MPFHVAGFLLLGWLLFWGAGAAMLLLPRRWARFWLFFAPVFGAAAASAVVWVAARHTDLPGTQAYAKLALLAPAALLVAGVLRRGGWRVAAGDLRRGLGPLVAMAGVLVFLLSPLGKVSESLTSVSLGSCDAADYAAGARVLGEFARDDRTGYLGHTEVVREHSVDNFFDYWLRLNHFTPSALLALANATFSWEIHESVTLLAAVLVAATVPLVTWLARTIAGLGGRGALLTGLLYGLSPLTWYGVWHAAIGQSLAAAGIGLLTWAGLGWWREGAGFPRLAAWAGTLVTAYWILFGAFNFIVLICLAPVAAAVTADAVWNRRGPRWLRWAAGMTGLLVATGVLCAERLFGLAERFMLFAEHDFGWRIPVLGPEGWLGLVAGTDLSPYGPVAAWSLAGFFSALFVLGLWTITRRNPSRGLRLLVMLAPVIGGYVFLQMRARLTGSNESYDAYKVLVVFYPVVLPLLLAWISRPALSGRMFRLAALLSAGFLLAAHGWTAWQTAQRVKQAPLVVTPELAAVQTLEERAEISSLNMLVVDFWSRLWANAFLLERPQYFQGYTYEGRRGTPLRGEWDLFGGLVEVTMRDPSRGFQVSRGFSAVRVDDPGHLRIALTDGWYDLERAPHLPAWRWTRGAAQLLVENPQDHPLDVELRMEIGSYAPRELQVRVNETTLYREKLAGDPRPVVVPRLTFPPGRNLLTLTADTPAVSPGGGDTRELGYIVTRLAFTVERPPAKR